MTFFLSDDDLLTLVFDICIVSIIYCPFTFHIYSLLSLDDFDLLVFDFFSLLFELFDDVDDFLVSSMIASEMTSAYSYFFDEDDLLVLVFFFSELLLEDVDVFLASSIAS